MRGYKALAGCARPHTFLRSRRSTLLTLTGPAPPGRRGRSDRHPLPSPVAPDLLRCSAGPGHMAEPASSHVSSPCGPAVLFLGPRAATHHQGTGDHDDERVAVARGLGVARLDLVLHALERQALADARQRAETSVCCTLRAAPLAAAGRRAACTHHELVGDGLCALVLVALEGEHGRGALRARYQSAQRSASTLAGAALT